MWRLTRPIEAGGYGFAMSEIQNFTLPQVYLLLTPESELGSGANPEAIRKWVSERKQRWTKKSDRQTQNK